MKGEERVATDLVLVFDVLVSRNYSVKVCG